ncbi:MAG: hypothetical protein FWC20_01645 [Oscillospiraceae bacterium]|nr:hypothetical protein [Oscillospiraceae bacterium]MCL2278097.1 hypothetical protein [Oscillospiraceae bacterium]
MVEASKLWTSDVMMMYPKQWVVMTQLEQQLKPLKIFGTVHFVTDNKDEAYKTSKAVRESGDFGKVMVVEGWDDTPQIGGLRSR